MISLPAVGQMLFALGVVLLFITRCRMAFDRNAEFVGGNLIIAIFMIGVGWLLLPNSECVAVNRRSGTMQSDAWEPDKC